MAGGRETAKGFASAGYSVMPALHGGFIVSQSGEDDFRRNFVTSRMAFTNGEDLLKFLTEAHRDEEPEKVRMAGYAGDQFRWQQSVGKAGVGSKVND